jgi:hypothetical protein
VNVSEEQKLRAKYAQVNRPHGGAGGGGHSLFLQKRLAKGQKYFDSGDYQVSVLKHFFFVTDGAPKYAEVFISGKSVLRSLVRL